MSEAISLGELNHRYRVRLAKLKKYKLELQMAGDDASPNRKTMIHQHIRAVKNSIDLLRHDYRRAYKAELNTLEGRRYRDE